VQIVHCIYDDLGNPWLDGGGAVRTAAINRRLAERGHQVVVICGGYPDAPRSDVRGGVLYLRTGLGPGGYIGSRLAYVAQTGRLLKALRYDIVVEDVSPYSPVFAPLRSRRGVARIASVQNLSGGHALRKYGWGPRGLLPHLVERPLLRRFADVITVSPGIAAALRVWWHPAGGGHLTVIPNSVGPAFAAIAAAPVLPAVRQEPMILFLARFDPYQKGLDRLLQAYAAAAPRLPGIRLELAGGGPPAAVTQVRAWATDLGLPIIEAAPGVPVAAAGDGPLVVLRGRLEGQEAVDALQRCLFLALPSRYEAWPLVAIEAAACGRPVLGSDVIGVRDAAPATAHGWLVPPDDGAALAAGMVRLADDAALRAALGTRGRAWAAGFTWDALAARQEAVYLDLLARAGGTAGLDAPGAASA